MFILAVLNLLGAIWLGANYALDPQPVYLFLGSVNLFLACYCISRSLDR